MPGKINHGHKSVKHEIIDKVDGRMLIIVGFAIFIFVFSIFAAKSLISQSFYQSRVISEKEKALSQINDNKKAVEELEKSFNAFQSEQLNILGGDPDGTGPIDGRNAKIVLDALPNKYDYPALSSSFEKILKEGGYEIGSIGGTEDVSLSANNLPTGTTTTYEIPYSFSVSSDVEGMKKLLETIEKSIRPMYVDNFQFQVGESILQARIGLHTYFTQPKTFELGSMEVK